MPPPVQHASSLFSSSPATFSLEPAGANEGEGAEGAGADAAVEQAGEGADAAEGEAEKAGEGEDGTCDGSEESFRRKVLLAGTFSL
ncbi:hypothetical protein [Methanothrix sp.]|uniref:hypothetical protein n=1 Tax=Methanothrix sp. TaxID=90426 RepID=UPI003BAFF547